MQPKIKNLKSRYIPVGNLYSEQDRIDWWMNDSDFHYPNILLNLLTIDREQLDKYKIDDDVFLLTDSGGFQVIRGDCAIDWKQSADMQVKLKATKIFSFDTPPVRRMTEGQNKFTYHEDAKVREVIESNLKVALEQSDYLKKNHPEAFKRFCYVLHGKNKEHLDYNLELFGQYFGGIDNYDDYFPGGITYAVKNDDPISLAIASYHAKIHFIDKGRYVHFLGCGSFNKMIVLIRNSITTFDASNALRGAINWTTFTPIQCFNSFICNKEDYWFSKGFCNCPTCIKNDFVKMIKEEPQLYGRHMVKHNLWHILKLNMFLDAIHKEKYTRVIKETIKISKKVLTALEFIDYADKHGFDIAYGKYKHYIPKDETKQFKLF